MFLNDQIIAIPTPYNNGMVDFKSLGKMMQHRIDIGFSRILVMGSTGDQHMLSLDEKKAIIAYIKENHADVPVMYGVSGVSTDVVLELADVVQTASKDIPIMLGIPPYVLPNQSEIYEYVASICERFQGSILLYNNEKRTGVNVGSETINRLMAAFPQIVAIKEAGSNAIESMNTPYVYTGFDLKIIDEAYYNVTTISGNILPKTANYFMRRLESKAHSEIVTEYTQIISACSAIGFVKVIKYIDAKKGVITSFETRRPMLELTMDEAKTVDTLMLQIEQLERKVEEIG